MLSGTGYNIVNYFSFSEGDRIDVTTPSLVTVSMTSSGYVLLSEGGVSIELVGVTTSNFSTEWLI